MGKATEACNAFTESGQPDFMANDGCTTGWHFSSGGGMADATILKIVAARHGGSTPSQGIDTLSLKTVGCADAARKSESLT